MVTRTAPTGWTMVRETEIDALERDCEALAAEIQRLEEKAQDDASIAESEREELEAEIEALTNRKPLVSLDTLSYRDFVTLQDLADAHGGDLGAFFRDVANVGWSQSLEMVEALA